MSGQDGGVGCFGDGDVGASPAFFAMACAIWRRAVEAAQTIDSEDDGAGGGLLEGRREGFGDFRQIG